MCIDWSSYEESENQQKVDRRQRKRWIGDRPLAQERQQQKVIEYEEPEAEFESPIDMKDKPWRNPFADYTKQQGARPDGEDKTQSEADEVSQALDELPRIHISEPTRQAENSYAVFVSKKNESRT